MKIGDSKPIAPVAKYAARVRSSKAAPSAARWSRSRAGWESASAT